MDKELEVWYENQFELFSTRGWKDFVEKSNEMFEVYNDLESVEDASHLERRKGILEILRWIDGWEGTVNNTYKQLVDDE